MENKVFIDDNVLQEALQKWGGDAQIKMMREECLESAMAIGKFYERNGSIDDMISEFADVAIMSRQMQLIPKFADKIQESINYKIGRLKRRIDKDDSYAE